MIPWVGGPGRGDHAQGKTRAEESGWARVGLRCGDGKSGDVAPGFTYNVSTLVKVFHLWLLETGVLKPVSDQLELLLNQT